MNRGNRQFRWGNCQVRELYRHRRDADDAGADHCDTAGDVRTKKLLHGNFLPPQRTKLPKQYMSMAATQTQFPQLRAGLWKGGRVSKMEQCRSDINLFQGRHGDVATGRAASPVGPIPAYPCT